VCASELVVIYARQPLRIDLSAVPQNTCDAPVAYFITAADHCLSCEHTHRAQLCNEARLKAPWLKSAHKQKVNNESALGLCAKLRHCSPEAIHLQFWRRRARSLTHSLNFCCQPPELCVLCNYFAWRTPFFCSCGQWSGVKRKE
jgi:hypothetical protein